MDISRSQGTDRIAEAVNNFFQSGKDLVFESAFSKRFPNLFNRIHLSDVGWNDKRHNIFRNYERL